MFLGEDEYVGPVGWGPQDMGTLRRAVQRRVREEPEGQGHGVTVKPTEGHTGAYVCCPPSKGHNLGGWEV